MKKILACMLILTLSISTILNVQAVTTSNVPTDNLANFLAEVTSRAAFFTYMNKGNCCVSLIRQSTLDVFKYDSDDDVKIYSASFSDGNFFSKTSYTVKIIYGNNKFWNRVAQNHLSSIYTVGNIINVILGVLSAYHSKELTDAAKNQFFSGLYGAIDGVNLNNEIKSLPSDGSLVIIFPFKATVTTLGIFPHEYSLHETATFVTWRGAMQASPEDEWPTWVTNF